MFWIHFIKSEHEHVSLLCLVAFFRKNRIFLKLFPLFQNCGGTGFKVFTSCLSRFWFTARNCTDLRRPSLQRFSYALPFRALRIAGSNSFGQSVADWEGFLQTGVVRLTLVISFVFLRVKIFDRHNLTLACRQSLTCWTDCTECFSDFYEPLDLGLR